MDTMRRRRTTGAQRDQVVSEADKPKSKQENFWSYVLPSFLMIGTYALMPMHLTEKLNAYLQNKYQNKKIKKNISKGLVYLFLYIPCRVMQIPLDIGAFWTILFALPTYFAGAFKFSSEPNSNIGKASKLVSRISLLPFVLPALFLLPLAGHLYKFWSAQDREQYLYLKQDANGKKLSPKEQLLSYLWRSVLTVPFLPALIPLAIAAASISFAINTIGQAGIGLAWLINKAVKGCGNKNKARNEARSRRRAAAKETPEESRLMLSESAESSAANKSVLSAFDNGDAASSAVVEVTNSRCCFSRPPKAKRG